MVTVPAGQWSVRRGSSELALRIITLGSLGFRREVLGVIDLVTGRLSQAQPGYQPRQARIIACCMAHQFSVTHVTTSCLPGGQKVCLQGTSSMSNMHANCTSFN